MVDVAGLVPGASEGRGRGNAFLADLANCDALIQVVDAAASTDIEGNPQQPSKDATVALKSMQDEIEFLTVELDNWILGLLKDAWSRGVRRVQSEGEKGIINFLHDRLTGLGSSQLAIATGYENFKSANDDTNPPWDWQDTTLLELAKSLRTELFPIHIAANKADLSPIDSYETLSVNGTIIPCMADMELALRRADSAGFIDYKSGQSSFTIAQKDNLNKQQQDALSSMQDKLHNMGSTGVSQIIDNVLFEQLNHIVVFPVQDETQWTDGDGKILPDALVVPSAISAKNLAYKVHTDLGEGFIRGVDGRTKRTVGSDHELSDGDILKIHSKN